MRGSKPALECPDIAPHRRTWQGCKFLLIVQQSQLLGITWQHWTHDISKCVRSKMWQRRWNYSSKRRLVCDSAVSLSVSLFQLGQAWLCTVLPYVQGKPTEKRHSFSLPFIPTSQSSFLYEARSVYQLNQRKFRLCNDAIIFIDFYAQLK